MQTKYVYVALCILGTLLPLSQFLPWFIQNGPDVQLFVKALFANRIGAFFGLDVVMSAVTLFVFVFAEGKKIQMPRLWLPVVATMCIGVSLGLPLFLYMRQVHLDGRICVSKNT